jgi:hypothetical protein
MVREEKVEERELDLLAFVLFELLGLDLPEHVRRGEVEM